MTFKLNSSTYDDEFASYMFQLYYIYEDYPQWKKVLIFPTVYSCQ